MTLYSVLLVFCLNNKFHQNSFKYLCTPANELNKKPKITFSSLVMCVAYHTVVQYFSMVDESQTPCTVLSIHYYIPKTIQTTISMYYRFALMHKLQLRKTFSYTNIHKFSIIYGQFPANGSGRRNTIKK